MCWRGGWDLLGPAPSSPPSSCSPTPDTAADAAGARSSSSPASPFPPPPAPPRPNPGLRAGAESAPGGEYATLPKPHLFSLRIPPLSKRKPPDSAARPLPSTSCGTQRCPGPRDPVVPRAAPIPNHPEPNVSHQTPVPTPPEIPRAGTPAPGPLEPLFSHLPGPGARHLRAPQGFQLRPISPPPLWGTYRRRPRLRVLNSRVAKSDGLVLFYIFSCSRGRVPPKPARGRGSSSSKGRFRGCWHEAGRCPQPV